MAPRSLTDAMAFQSGCLPRNASTHASARPHPALLLRIKVLSDELRRDFMMIDEALALRT